MTMSKLTRLGPTAVLVLALAALVTLPAGNSSFAQYPRPDRPAAPPDSAEEDLPDEQEMAATMRALRTADARLNQVLRKRTRGRPVGAAGQDPVSRELRGALADVQRARQHCQRAWRLEKQRRR